MANYKKLKGWHLFCLSLLLCFVFTLQVTIHALAVPYGSGSYGNCSFQQACPPPAAAPTVVATPSGLEVAIDLTNGQSIPLDGYTITITPLNGQNSSFKQADIYINGALVHTATPDETGTVRWLWSPNVTGTTSVKIIITDENGATTTQDFTVKVSTQPLLRSQTKQVIPSVPKQNGIVSSFQNISHSIKKAIKALPVPVAHSFPYIIFVLLFADVILFLLQTERELREYRTMQTLLTRARAVDEAKKSFVQLVSHYLRTPLTVILGNIDLLNSDSAGNVQTISDLKTTAQRMRDKIETLITQVHDEQPMVVSSVASTNSVWKLPGLFLPIVLVAVIWLLFDFLVSHIGNFSLNSIELLIQSVTFTVLAAALYEVFRYRQLHRRDSQKLQLIVTNEQGTGQARDSLITHTVETLTGELQRMDELSSQLNSSVTTVERLKSAQNRFHEILTKFATASRLIGSRSNQSFSLIQFSNLLAQANEALQLKADERGITIQNVHNAALLVQEPELLTFVLVSILDNAIAYSKDKTTLEINATTTATQATITVTDHGSGIAADKLSLLFQPFYKAEGAETFNHEGMGFSLYLDWLIMLYLGGTIELSSKPNEGTTVTLQLAQPDQKSLRAGAITLLDVPVAAYS